MNCNSESEENILRRESLLVGLNCVSQTPFPMLKKAVTYFGGLVKKLVEIKDTPHAIAGGAAIGIFLGFPPLFGVKTLLALGLAYALRCNPIAAVVAVCLTDILTPFLPILLTAQYDLGAWALGGMREWPPSLDAHHHLALSDMLKWTTFASVAVPMLVGSLFLAVPAAAVTYPFVLRITRQNQKRREIPTE